MLVLFSRMAAMGLWKLTVMPEAGSKLLDPNREPEDVLTPVSL